MIIHRCACEKSYMSIIMTSITWAGPSCVQEPATILAPQNRTQGRCEVWRDTLPAVTLSSPPARCRCPPRPPAPPTRACCYTASSASQRPRAKNAGCCHKGNVTHLLPIQIQVTAPSESCKLDFSIIHYMYV